MNLPSPILSLDGQTARTTPSAPAQTPQPEPNQVPWRRSIRLKLVVTAIVVEALMLSMLLANSYRLVSSALESQTRARLESLAPLINASLAGRVFQRDHTEIQVIIDQLTGSDRTDIRYILIHDRNEKVLTTSGGVSAETLPPEDHSIADALGDLTYDTQVPLALADANVGSAHFGLSLANMVDLRSNVLRQSLIIAGLEILFSLILLASGGYLLTRHLTNLLAATRRITRGDYATAIQIPGRDEISLLADDFNRMAQTVQSRMEALQESEQRFRSIFNAAGDAIFIHDAHTGRVLDVNQRMLEMYGCTREEALSSSPAEFSANIPPYTAEHAAELIKQAFEQEAVTFEWLARAREGHTFWVEVNLRHTRIGQESRVIALVRDISERKKAEAEQRLAATSFETNEGIIITDHQGKILRVNQAFSRITGYSAQEAVGANPRILNSQRQDREFYREMWNQLLAQGRWRGEVWNRRKNGEVFPCWLSISAVRDPNGGVSNYVGVSTDLTELKAQQRENEIRAEEERVVGKLLRLSLFPVAIDDYLKQALDQLLDSVPWLGTQQRGGIFLTEEGDIERALRLVAHRQFTPPLVASCSRVPFGHCLCGQAAEMRRIQFSDRIDERHHTHYEGITPHGHYNVPILANDRLLGVMVLYLPHGHRRSESEVAFLGRVADVLGMGISRREVEAAVEYQAYHDPLTGLPNRRLLLDHLEQELALSRRVNVHGALLFIDLDHFKNLNDTLGHGMGDHLLIQVAKRLDKRLRRGDTAARLGGDEFVVLLTGLGRISEAAGGHALTVATQLAEELAEPYDLQGHRYHCTASIGIALFPDLNESADDLLRHADTAMYAAKRSGRDSIHFFRPEMQAAVEQRLALDSDLREGLEERQFLLRYQPQVELSSGRIVGVEALIRWRHPTQGLISPCDFIPVCEETGLILQMGEWALLTAAAQARAWLDAGHFSGRFSVAVNVSPRQFRTSDFVSQVRHALETTGLPPQQLKLEITEGLVISDLEDTINKMRALRDIGVRFSMDDFGTGYSSLSNLKRLPLHQLKIDRAFIVDMASDPHDAALVSTIIRMGKDLDLEVIAEGVETRQQLQLLKERRCDQVQGHLASPPLSAEELLAWKAEWDLDKLMLAPDAE